MTRLFGPRVKRSALSLLPRVGGGGARSVVKPEAQISRHSELEADRFNAFKFAIA